MNIKLKDTLRYGLIFGVILGLPLVVYKSCSTQWLELTWHYPLDLSMLEWTNAFLCIFLFLLLLEHFRQTGNLNFLFVGIGLMGMGIMSFFYVISSPGTNFSIWLKGVSLLLAGLSFLLCILPISKHTERDFLRGVFAYVIPILVITILTLSGLNIMKNLLPSMLNSENMINSTFAKLFFTFTSFMLFLSAVYWLRMFFSSYRKENLAIALMILLIAQMCVVVNYIRVWGVLWWGWHIILTLIIFVVSIYLLVICIRNSIVWRLLFSLGLTFGITIVISSAVIQLRIKKIFTRISAEKLLNAHKNMLNEYFILSFNNKTLKNRGLSENLLSKLKSIRLKGILTNKLEEGRIIFNYETGRIIYVHLPEMYTAKGFIGKRISLPNKRTDVLTRKIAAAFFAIPAAGKYSKIMIGDKMYFLVGNKIPLTHLCVVDIVGEDAIISKQVKEIKYVIIAVSMLTLLCGFFILIILLNYQLILPLTRLVKAAHKLEGGDFSVEIKCSEQHEIGKLSRTFNNMVQELREFYNKLETNLKEKEVALRIAEKVNETQNNFFADISHSLRTPLHSILSFSHFGMNTEQHEKNKTKIQEYFQRIHRSAEGLLSIINELIDLIKIGSGSQSLEKSSVSLFMVVLQAYSELKYKFIEKNIKFNCPKPEIDTVIYMDRLKMTKAISQLFDNALKFSPPGSTVTVTITKEDDFVVLSVKDEGPGIPYDKKNFIFDKFVQFSDSSLAEHERSFGLGLYIVKEIIRMHNGIIEVENVEKGANFIIKLPGPEKTTSYTERNRK